jgi:hypothetical protein
MCPLRALIVASEVCPSPSIDTKQWRRSCQRQDTLAAFLVDNASSNRVIARQFRVGHDAVQRHRQNHLPAALTKAKAVEQVTDAGTLLQQVQELLSQAPRLTNRCEHSKDLRGALSGIRTVSGVLELLGKVSGQLTSSINVTTSVLVALTNLDDGQVKQTLLDAGHAGWIRVNPNTPAANELRVFELLAKGLSGLDDGEISNVLLASGKGASFPSGKPN